MDDFLCLMIIIIGVAVGAGIIIGEYSRRKNKEEINNEENWHRTHYECPFCEKVSKYNGIEIPTKMTCPYCDNKYLLYEGTITISRTVARDPKTGRDIKMKKKVMALKTKETKTGDTYHQEIFEDQSINIQDSIIQRSSIGVSWDDGDSDGRIKKTKIQICPYCGEDLDFPKAPKFCPYCKEQMSM